MPPAEQLRQDLSARSMRVLLPVLVVLALVSAGVGAENGVHRSQDFQWSGAHLLAQHVDPWAEYLRGDPEYRLIGTQIPNYLPILYLLMLPLGLMPVHAASLVWLGCNLFFAVASGMMAAHLNGLRGRAALLVVCLLLMATATRNTMGNGQQGLLVLFLWCVASNGGRRISPGGASLAGISYLKFSFAPPVFLYLLFRSGVRAALTSLLPALAGLGMVWWGLACWRQGGDHTPASLLRLAVEPFEVARTGFTPLGGDQNLMYLVQSTLHLQASAATDAMELAAALAVCVPLAYLAFWRERRRSTAWHLAVLATMSFGLFKHHAYDGVVLIFPLCYALRRWRQAWARVVLVSIGYLFYGQRALEAMQWHPRWSYVVEFGMLMMILAAVYRLREEPAVEAVPISFPRPAREEVALAG